MATMNLIDDGGQSCFIHWRRDLLVDDALAIFDGCQPVPTGPGFGRTGRPGDGRGAYALDRRRGPFIIRPVH
jgi:hypothetical protein